MILTLTPIRGLPGQSETRLAVAGDVLTVDGTAYDLSPIPEGGEGWPAGDTPIAGPILREGGQLRATVVVRLDDSAQADQPDSPWTITAKDGPVAIPARRIEEPRA